MTYVVRRRWRSVAVVTRRKSECRGPGPLEVAAARAGGYLASVVTEETGCGSPDSPWLISAPAGQTIQLRLLDFDAASRADAWTTDDAQQPLICQVRLIEFKPLMQKVAKMLT